MKTLKDFITENKSGDSSLHDWFTKSKSSDGKPGWVQLGGRYAGKSCAKQPGQTTKPKCGSSKMAANMSDKEEDAAARRKRAKDPNANRKGKAINVATEEVVSEDACTTKVKSRYSVWPSAYASGALVRCRKVGAKNWGNKTKKEETELISFKTFVDECWTGYKAVGTKKKGNRMVPNCVPEEVEIEEGMQQTLRKYVPGYAKRQIDNKMDAEKFGKRDVDRDANFQRYKKIQDKLKKEETELDENHIAVAMGKEMDDEGSMIMNQLDQMERSINMMREVVKDPKMQVPAWVQSKVTLAADYIETVSSYMSSKNEEVEHLFDIIEEMVEELATELNVDSELVWEELESVSDEELIDESAAWQRKEGKDPKGGLNRKGIASYRRENPGSKLSMAVTTKPSKLKPGSKAANRRKSFCARMGGMRGAMKKPNGKPTRKALALRKWNC